MSQNEARSGSAEAGSDRTKKSPKVKPALVIYRPPGLRNQGSGDRESPPTGGAVVFEEDKQSKPHYLDPHFDDRTASANTRNDAAQSNGHKARLHSPPTKVAEFASRDSKDRFHDDRSHDNATSNGAMPIKPAGSATGTKQAYNKNQRSKTSPLVGLVPAERKASPDIIIDSRHDTTHNYPSKYDANAIMMMNLLGTQFHPPQPGLAFPGLGPLPLFPSPALNAAHLSQAKKTLALSSGQLFVTNGTGVLQNQTQDRNSFQRTNAASSNASTLFRPQMSSGTFQQTSPPKWGSSQIADAKALITELQMGDVFEGMEPFMQSNFMFANLASQLGTALVLAPIEQGKPSKTVCKLCSLLLEGPTGKELHDGLLAGCQQYLECADSLRSEHFACWLNFIGFLSDLFAAAGFTFDGELVQLLFKTFYYMLKPPVLETLKIEEVVLLFPTTTEMIQPKTTRAFNDNTFKLEAIISCLVTNGFQIERECPEELASLRDLLRDAFICAGEPWARKMILLLVELSASSWKLPLEANEYYFHPTSITPAATPSPSLTSSSNATSTAPQVSIGAPFYAFA